LRPRLAPIALFCLLAASSAACSDAEGPNADLSPSAQDLQVDEEEAARLRALGYTGVAEAPADPDRLGVVHHDRQRAQPGLNYFTNAQSCSAWLVDMDGSELRSWQQDSCDLWGNSVLLSGGDVLVIHESHREHRNPRKPGAFEPLSEARELLRLGPDGRVLWRTQLPVHHDVDLTPRDQIATLTYRHRLVADVHPRVPVRDHYIAVLNPEGELLEEVSILDLLPTAPAPFHLKEIEPKFNKKEGLRQVDLLHSNSIEWMRRPGLVELDPLYSPSNLLISLRHQDCVAIVDWDRKRVLWIWGQGELSGPHDATLLRNGHVLVFDNGLGRGWSRVVEVDPLENRVVWEYRAPAGEDFFTATRGAAQRLANGNTLITESDKGRAFEVTPSGEVVWDFLNPNVDEEGKPIVIVRMRRLAEPPSPDGPFEHVD
jgi:hypothetical protein